MDDKTVTDLITSSATMLVEIERLNAVFKRECDLTVDLRAMCERLRAALSTARYAMLKSGYVGPGPHGTGDPEINAIDAALGDQQTAEEPK